ncbi:MAG: hypothetical protein M1481_05745 [Candidatus Thermoplasmatota archaeon]|jgi:hypothetical protein|nr:hypothetical protein [Candidatus Thermoplasmatota archaeon]MCL5963294.1 hypothetical protein [Candidatus Thermoplasmatota archaeon]
MNDFYGNGTIMDKRYFVITRPENQIRDFMDRDKNNFTTLPNRSEFFYHAYWISEGIPNKIATTGIPHTFTNMNPYENVSVSDARTGEFFSTNVMMEDPYRCSNPLVKGIDGGQFVGKVYDVYPKKISMLSSRPQIQEVFNMEPLSIDEQNKFQKIIDDRIGTMAQQNLNMSSVLHNSAINTKINSGRTTDTLFKIIYGKYSRVRKILNTTGMEIGSIKLTSVMHNNRTIYDAAGHLLYVDNNLLHKIFTNGNMRVLLEVASIINSINQEVAILRFYYYRVNPRFVQCNISIAMDNSVDQRYIIAYAIDRHYNHQGIYDHPRASPQDAVLGLTNSVI